MDRGAWQATVHGVAGVLHDLVTKPLGDKTYCSELSSLSSPFLYPPLPTPTLSVAKGGHQSTKMKGKSQITG